MMNWLYGPLYNIAIDLVFDDKDLRDLNPQDAVNIVNSLSIIDDLTSGRNVLRTAVNILSNYDFEQEHVSLSSIIPRVEGYRRLDGRKEKYLLNIIEDSPSLEMDTYIPSDKRYEEAVKESNATAFGPVTIENKHGCVSFITYRFKTYDNFLYYDIHDINVEKYKNKEALNADEVEEFISSIVCEHFWQDKVCLVEPTGKSSVFPVSFSWIDPKNSKYFGKLREYDDLIEKFQNKPGKRSFLLQGPPGTGKTTYCIDVAKKYSDRIFAINAETFTDLQQSAWNFLTEMLQPDVVILNDIDRIGEHESGKVLDFLDDNYCTIPLVLITTNHLEDMTDAFYRPGRVDYIVEIDYPSDDERFNTYKMLAKENNCSFVSDAIYDALVDIGQDITTAHVTELFKRINILGLDDERVVDFYGIEDEHSLKIKKAIMRELIEREKKDV